MLKQDCSRITLHLRVTHQDTIPGWLGRAMQGIYLHAMEAISPEVSLAIHNGSAYHPYTLSDVLPMARAELRELRRGETLTVILTTLHPEVTMLTLNAVVPTWVEQGIDLHGQLMPVDRAEVHTASYEGMLEAATQQTDRYIQMRFLTPTSVKKSRPPSADGERRESAVLPLPNPDRVFISLYERWNSFAPVKLPEALRDYLSHEILLHYCNIRTHYVDRQRANKGGTTGFMGDVTFYCDSRTQPYLGYTHALAAFALYSGVGIKTTQGMGTVQLMPRTERASST